MTGLATLDSAPTPERTGPADWGVGGSGETARVTPSEGTTLRDALRLAGGGRAAVGVSGETTGKGMLARGRFGRECDPDGGPAVCERASWYG